MRSSVAAELSPWPVKREVHQLNKEYFGSARASDFPGAGSDGLQANPAQATPIPHAVLFGDDDRKILQALESGKWDLQAERSQLLAALDEKNRFIQSRSGYDFRSAATIGP